MGGQILDYSDLGFVIRGTILQIIVFTLIPFIWWLFIYRKKESFFRWVGFFPPKKINIQAAIIAIGLYCVVWIVLHLPVVNQFTQLSASGFTGMGISAIAPALIVCFVQNGLTEELLFRGFVLKRFATKMKPSHAIILQAVLFALLHNVFAMSEDWTANIFIFATPFIGGLMLGWISIKKFDGWIVPGILLHGMGNLIVNLVQAFS